MSSIEEYIQDKEKIIYQTHPSLKGYFLSLTISFLAFVIIGLLAMVDFSFYPYLFIPAGLLIIIFIDQHSKLYIITNKRIITLHSFFSEEVKASSFKHVTSVSLKRTVIGKIFNFGTLKIHTSGSGTSPEFNWKYIDKPVDVRIFLENKIK